MTTTQLLQFATQVTFALLFRVVARRAVIRPLRVNVDTALFFGAAAFILNVSSILAVLHITASRVLQLVTLALLIALPYLFLRLLSDYAPVSGWLLRAAEAVFALLVISISVIPNALLIAAVLVLVVYFLGLEIYAGIRFAALGLRSVGLNRRRMVAVAAGSISLGLAVGVAGLSGVVRPLAAVLGPVTELLALFSGLAYFVGFSPPRWLRRFWQMPQINEFVLGTGALSGADDLDQTLAKLEDRAAQTAGVAVARIGLAAPDRPILVFHTHPAEVPLEGSFSGEVFASQKARFMLRKEFPKATLPLVLSSDAAGAAAMIAAPLSVADERLGVLVIAADRIPFFADDDVALGQLLAAQAALVVQTVRRNQAVGRQAELLELAHDAILVRDLASGVITFWNRGPKRPTAGPRPRPSGT